MSPLHAASESKRIAEARLVAAILRWCIPVCRMTADADNIGTSPQQSNNLAGLSQYLSPISVAAGTQFVPGLCLQANHAQTEGISNAKRKHDSSGAA